ncbi:unnamed protein product [Chondrus crispus]|uniref:Uncharacterized protein n=1 Tax=Chondrus crispus TaxID=2769 RepID=R7QIZ1_CHOCR|nr:unnamed protein product [Chondrus crispus]CDF37733.1 unnamed protein product [Chondrus crispus]|eukprot:XP_005717604.1 unnamed protein product [Chondrus crispus]
MTNTWRGVRQTDDSDVSSKHNPRAKAQSKSAIPRR